MKELIRFKSFDLWKIMIEKNEFMNTMVYDLQY